MTFRKGSLHVHILCILHPSKICNNYIKKQVVKVSTILIESIFNVFKDEDLCFKSYEIFCIIAKYQTVRIFIYLGFSAYAIIGVSRENNTF